jgi:hypothetical protein
VSRFEQNEISGSKGEANFVWKCKNCKVFLTVRVAFGFELMEVA